MASGSKPGLQIIVNDADLHLSQSSGSITRMRQQSPFDGWYEGDQSLLDDLFSVTFEGNSIALYGLVQNGTDLNFASAVASIDGGPFSPVFSKDNVWITVSPTQWYQNPVLSPLPSSSSSSSVGQHQHNITFRGFSASIDYALVSVEDQTNITGKEVWVDDASDEVTYQGTGWKTSTTPFFNGIDSVYPLGNSTRTSTTLGDSIIFRFSGNGSISVFGSYDYSRIGSLSVSYIIDSDPHQRTDSNLTFDGQLALNGMHGQAGNVVLFSTNSLTAGNHTLTMNITKCENTTFVFDYLTYQPGFANLAAKPTFPSLSSSPSSDSPGGATSSGTSGSGGANLPQIGGIVGGGVVLILMVVFLTFFIKKWRKKRLCASLAPLPPAIPRPVAFGISQLVSRDSPSLRPSAGKGNIALHNRVDSMNSDPAPAYAPSSVANQPQHTAAVFNADSDKHRIQYGSGDSSGSSNHAGGEPGALILESERLDSAATTPVDGVVPFTLPGPAERAASARTSKVAPYSPPIITRNSVNERSGREQTNSAAETLAVHLGGRTPNVGFVAVPPAYESLSFERV